MELNLENAVNYHYDKFPPKSLNYGQFVEPLIKATDAVARYDQMLKNMHNSEILLAPLRNQEAVISSRMEGTVSTTIDIALKLEEFLDITLIEPLEFLKSEADEPPEITESGIEDAASSLERYILSILEEIGLEIFATSHAPFSAVSLSQSKRRDENVRILMGISSYTEQMVKRAKILSSLSHVTKTQSVFVVSGSVKRIQIEDTVLVAKEELKKIKDPEEFTCVIEERLDG